MPTPNQPVTEFLLSRRSRPAKSLSDPAPTREELRPILTAAARTPDHGKLEPWRFIVLGKSAMPRLADQAEECAVAAGLDDAAATKARGQFDRGILAIAVIEITRPSAKVPVLEQTYSAGAVCLAMVNAALAQGWGANWLSGFASHDRGFMTRALGLSEDERVAGFIHIGTETTIPVDRPRPDVDAITEWVSE